MTKTTEVVGVAAVEKRVKAQVHEISAIAALLRDFTQAQDKYAQDYSKLPLVAPQSGESIAALPPLQRVVQTLEKALATTIQVQSSMASELTSTVLMPLEAFERQQRHQTKQLLTEIEDALQSEKHLHNSMKSGLRKGRSRLSKQQSSVAVLEDNNQEPEESQNEDLTKEEPERWVTRLRELKERRDRERAIVRQRLEELDLTNEQQEAVVDGQLKRCFEVLARHTAQVVTEITMLMVPVASSAAMESSTDTKDVLQTFDLHVEVVSWMIALFAQLLPVEDTVTKRLQTLAKGHALATITTVFPPATVTSPESTTLWGFVQSHRQLMSNLSDPIGRTLRFSKLKQETIRKELLESLEETGKLVQASRTKVRDKEFKLVQYVQQQLSQQQQQQQQQPQQLLGATGNDAMVGASMSSFGLRSAVAAWTKQLQSPKKPLFKAKSLLSVDTNGTPREASPVSMISPPGTPKSPELVALEKELADAKAYLETVEKSEAQQRSEMVRTLQNTAMIGVKTMELMVQDHLKNMIKAMTIATTTIAKCSGSDQQSQVDSVESTSRATYGSLVMFDQDDCSTSSDWIKLVGGEAEEKAPAPEQSSSETETEGVEDVEENNADCSMVTESSACATGNDAVSTILSGTLTSTWEFSKVADFLQRVAETIHKTLPVISRSLDAILKSVERSPDHWRLAATLVVIVSVVHVAFRVARLQAEYHELLTMQTESSRNLQELLQLMAAATAQ